MLCFDPKSDNQLAALNDVKWSRGTVSIAQGLRHGFRNGDVAAGISVNLSRAHTTCTPPSAYSFSQQHESEHVRI